MHITIKAAEARDYAAIRSCAIAAYEGYIDAIGRAPAPMTANYAALIANGDIHVAQDEKEKVIGFIVFMMDGDKMLLENIAVRPDAAGKGIGKALIFFCEETARQAGASTVSLYTNEKMTGNLLLYPHLGYHETGRRKEDGFCRVFFEKHLI